MGINGLLQALKPIAKQVHVRQYAGQRVAVDGYSWLHKGAYSCARELCEGIWTDRFVAYFVSRIKMLRAHGVEPIIVFDGGRLPIKGEEEESRRRARSEARDKAAAHMAAGNVAMAQECYQRCVDITPAMAKQVIEELKVHGVAFLVAPYEADAQMAYLARSGQVQLVVTEDSDLLAYGCPRVLYKLDRTGAGEELSLEDLPNCPSLPLSGWTSDQFLQLCIMAGCDFLAQLPGIGLKKAHGVLRKYRSFTKVVKMLRFNGTKVPPEYEARFQLALWAFRHARVYCTAEKAMIHLAPLPGGGIGGADVDVPAAVAQLATQQQHERLDFLGPLLPPEVARGIAEGELDPNTHKPFDLAAIYAGCSRPPAHLTARLADPGGAYGRQPYSSSQAAAAFSGGGGNKPRVGLSRRHAGQSSGGGAAGRRTPAGGSSGGRQQQSAGKKRASLGIANYFQKPAGAAGTAAGASGTQPPAAGAASAAPAPAAGGTTSMAAGAPPAPPAQGITQSIAQALSTLGQHMQQRQQQQQAEKQQLLQQLAEQRQQQEEQEEAVGVAGPALDLPAAKRQRSSTTAAAAAADGGDGAAAADADAAAGQGLGSAPHPLTASLDPSLGPSLDPSQLGSGNGSLSQGLGVSGGAPAGSSQGGGSGLLGGSQPSFLCSSSDGLPGSQPGRSRGPVSALTALFHPSTQGALGRNWGASQRPLSLAAAAGGDDPDTAWGNGASGGGLPSQLRPPGWGGQLFLDSSSSDVGGSSLDGCGSSSGLSCGAPLGTSCSSGAAGAAVMDGAASASFGAAAHGGADMDEGDQGPGAFAAAAAAGGGSSTDSFMRMQQALRKGFTQPRQQLQSQQQQQPHAQAGPCTSGFFAPQQQQQHKRDGSTARRHSRFKEQLLQHGGGGAAADTLAAADALDMLQNSQEGSLDSPRGHLGPQHQQQPRIMCGFTALQEEDNDDGDDARPHITQQQQQREAMAALQQLSDSSEPSSTTSNDENAEDASALEQLGITHVRQYAKLAHKVVKSVAKQQQQQQQHVPLAPKPGLLNTQQVADPSVSATQALQQQQRQHVSQDWEGAAAAAPAAAAAGGGRMRLQLGLSKASSQQQRTNKRQGPKATGARGGSAGSFAAKLAGLRYDASMFVPLEDDQDEFQEGQQQQQFMGQADASPSDGQQPQGGPFGRAPNKGAAVAVRKPFKAPWLAAAAADSPSLTEVLTGGAVDGGGLRREDGEDEMEEQMDFGAFGGYACAGAGGAGIGAVAGAAPRRGGVGQRKGAFWK